MMTRLISALLFTLSILGCNTPMQNESIDNEALKKMINEKNIKISSFYKKGMVDSLATFFTKHSIQMIPNRKPIVGVEEYKESWSELMQFGSWNFNLKTVEVKASGKLAVELGKYTLEFTPNENSPIPKMSDKGNYMALWEKIGGKWQVIWDAPVSELPLPNLQAEKEMEQE